MNPAHPPSPFSFRGRDDPEKTQSLRDRLIKKIPGARIEVLPVDDQLSQRVTDCFPGFPESLLDRDSKVDSMPPKVRRSEGELDFTLAISSRSLLAGRLDLLSGDGEKIEAFVVSILDLTHHLERREARLRRVERRCNQLDSTARVLRLEKQRSLQENYDYHQELRSKEQLYTQSLEVEVRKRTQELHSVNRELEKALKVKSELLANVSHEIRTPMNAILGMTDLVLCTNLSDEQRDCLRHVYESSEALLTIINDLIDLSRIEDGNLEFQRRKLNLREVVGEVTQGLAPRAHAKGIEIAWRVARGIPDALAGDGQRIRQILTHLVGNSIKFTHTGSVSVEVLPETSTGDGLRLHFRISDTGIGIPREKIKLVFDAFAQVDGTATRRYGGTGLGLAICSRLIRAMGGKIWVDSEIDRGSTFHFTLELGTLEGRSASQRTPTPDRTGQSVLIVDPNRVAAESLADLFIDLGFRPRVVPGLSLAREWMVEQEKTGRKTEAIFVDHQVLRDSGPEVIRRMTEGFQIPWVLLVNSSFAENPESTGPIRFREILRKPVRDGEVCSLLFELFGHSQTSGLEGENPAPSPPSNQHERSLHILLVEDNPVNQKLATMMLERMGHRIRRAENGQVGVELWEQEKPDLVLMDIQMPVLDGLGATEKIRELETGSGSRTPIVALTAHALPGDRELCLDRGMDDYLTKPIRRKCLFEVIQRILNRENPSVEHPPADSSSSP